MSDIPDTELHRNLYIPCGYGRTAEIDAVLLTRKGVFVIEEKDWRGRVRGSVRLNDWSVQQKAGTKPVKRYSPIKQNARHIEAMARFTHLPPSVFWNLIVFTSHADLKKIPPNTKEFTIVQEDQLRSTVSRRLRARKDIFTEAELVAIEKSLKKAEGASGIRKRIHVVHARQAQRKRLAKKARRQRRGEL